jgi:foldase protein PrsA
MRKQTLAFWCLFAAIPCASSAAPAPKDSDVMAVVNEAKIRRSDVNERLWKDHSAAVIGQMVDEALLTQAVKDLSVSTDKAEVEARLKRIQSQFPDEATFQSRLAASGSSLEGLRRQIEDSVLREQLTVKMKNLSVTDAELKEFFNANQDRLGAPEAVRLGNIFVATEKEASDFLLAIKAGADFAMLADNVSLDRATKGKGGDLGLISRGMLQPEIEKVIFALKPGEVSAPIRVQNGFQLFKVSEIRPAKPAVFDEIKDDLRRAMLADKISKAWPAAMQELRDKAKIDLKK